MRARGGGRRIEQIETASINSRRRQSHRPPKVPRTVFATILSLIISSPHVLHLFDTSRDLHEFHNPAGRMGSCQQPLLGLFSLRQTSLIHSLIFGSSLAAIIGLTGPRLCFPPITPSHNDGILLDKEGRGRKTVRNDQHPMTPTHPVSSHIILLRMIDVCSPALRSKATAGVFQAFGSPKDSPCVSFGVVY